MDFHRSEDCKNYEDCLTRAAIAQWPSFSCQGCDGYFSMGKPCIDGFIYEKEPDTYSLGNTIFEDFFFCEDEEGQDGVEG